MLKKKRRIAAFGLFLMLLFAITGTALAAENAATPIAIQCGENTLRVTNGSSVSTTITVANTGTAVIADIKPQADLPYKWLLESVTPTALNLKGGESGIFTLTLAVPSSQNAITQTMKLRCANAAVTSNELTIPITVSTDLKYLWILVGAVASVSLLTVLYIKKHGRR